MSLPKSVFTGLTLTLLVTACSRQTDRAQTTQADMVAVARLMVTLDRVVSEEDLDGFLALVSEDAVYMLPDKPAIVGKRAIGEFYRTLFAATNIEIVHQVLEIDVADDLIIHRGNATGSTTRRTDGESVDFDDKYLLVIKRSADGSLRVWRAMMNGNAAATR